MNRPLTACLRQVGNLVPGVRAWLAFRLPRVGISRVDGPRGHPLLLDGGDLPDATTTRSYWLGTGHYEPAVLPVFSVLAEDCRVILDVGANIGIFTLAASVVNPKARVVAFEPEADTYGVLRRNVVLNRAEQVLCVQAAVSDSTDRVPIFSPAGQASTISSSDIGHRVTWTPGPWRCDYAPSIVLDDFAVTHLDGGVQLVKIDVEGAEDRVLAGAHRLITADRPHLFCELLETPSGERAAAILEEHRSSSGYHAYVLTPVGPVPEAMVRPGPEWNHLLTTLDPQQLGARLAAAKP